MEDVRSFSVLTFKFCPKGNGIPRLAGVARSAGDGHETSSAYFPT